MKKISLLFAIALFSAGDAMARSASDMPSSNVVCKGEQEGSPSQATGTFWSAVLSKGRTRTPGYSEISDAQEKRLWELCKENRPKDAKTILFEVYDVCLLGCKAQKQKNRAYFEAHFNDEALSKYIQPEFRDKYKKDMIEDMAVSQETECRDLCRESHVASWQFVLGHMRGEGSCKKKNSSCADQKSDMPQGHGAE